MAPTYFLFSGRLFHAEALDFLPNIAAQGGTPTAEAQPQPRRGEDPGPEGPEGEPVGEEEDEPAPAPGPGAPMEGGPDGNPIDPRVFSH